MPVLTLSGVSAVYDSVMAVEDVSFDVKKGDFLCVVGANGSGKSTLLKAILGLVPLSRGTVLLEDREKVSYVPQIETAERSFPATVREIVLAGTQRKGRLFPFYTAADKRDAEEAMKLFGVDRAANRQIEELSGGQQQRAMLARAMCRKPSLLLLDEPCSGLDADAKRDFYATLVRLNAEREVSVVMVSHDLEDVEACAKRVAVLARKLAFLGDVEEWLRVRGDFRLFGGGGR